MGADAAGRPAIRIFVERRSRDLERRLPRWLEGVPVEIAPTGELRALDPSPDAEA